MEALFAAALQGQADEFEGVFARRDGRGSRSR